MLLSWLVTRLWQRASETIWYQRRIPALLKEPEPMPEPPPAPPPALEPEPADFTI